MNSLHPSAEAQQRGLRAWIGSPLQLLHGAQAAQAPLMTRLLSVTPIDGMTLQCPYDPTGNAALSVGQPVIGLVYTGSEIAQFRSEIQAVLPAPVNQIRVASPRVLKFHRLRAERRIPVCIPATVTVGEDRSADVTLVDITESGCNVTAAAPLGWPGARVRVRLADPCDVGDPEIPAVAALDLAGEVRWTRQIATDDRPHFACGIRFERSAHQSRVLGRLAARLRAGH